MVNLLLRKRKPLECADHTIVQFPNVSAEKAEESLQNPKSLEMSQRTVELSLELYRITVTFPNEATFDQNPHMVKIRDMLTEQMRSMENKGEE